MNPARRSSWFLLAGIACGFLGAVVEGHRAAAYSKPDGFHRFHQRISPDALYYPPYAMLERLALARWQPGRTLVIIGGNSILNGVGQPRDVLWSSHLQALLGDRYVVVNLALRRGYPAHAGALVAESLLRRGYPVLYVANTNPTAGAGLPADPPYGYHYWQARAQHRLADYAPRDAAEQAWLAALPAGERRLVTEERLGATLEAWTRHQSLWHHVAYRHVFTVWTPLLAQRFWQARVAVPDFEPPAPPLAERYRAASDHELNLVRGYSYLQGQLQPDGRWTLSADAAQRLAAGIEAAFIPELRPRMLVLLDENSPFYRDRLDPAEQARNRAVYDGCAEVWRRHGIACEVPAAGFTAADFFDRSHLAGEGGRKLAAFVADRIRRLPPP